MSLETIFPKETIVVNLESTEKDELFEELVEIIHSAVPSMSRKEALDSLLERESKMSTGIMHNVAIPHALIPSMTETVGAIGISTDGIDYDSLDKAPVYLVFMIIGAQGATEQHMQVLKQLAGVLQLPDFVDRMRQCKSPSEVHNLLRNSEESLYE